MGFSDSFPADAATGVALDTGIVLFGSVVAAGGYDFRGDFYAESLELRDGDGQPVASAVVPWYSDAGELELVWAPAEPLAPDSTYTIAATLHRDASSSQYTEEQLAIGASLAATFTTGSATTAPLTMGALQLRVTEVEVDIRECHAVGDCGTSCVVVGTRTVPELVVTLPAVEGGNDVAGYSAYLAVSAGAALPFTGIGAPIETGAATLVELHSRALPAGSPLEVAITLDGEPTGPFVPCVSAITWDPSGKTVSPEPLCATVTVTVPPIEGEGGAGGNGTGGSSGGTGAIGGDGQGGDANQAGDGTGGSTPGSAGEAPGAGGSTGGGSGSGSGSGSGASAGRVSAGASGTGQAGTRNEPMISDNPKEVGGCGCRTAPEPATPGVPFFAVAMALLGGALRRRRAGRQHASRNA